ncbi:MAG: hypothetical protein ACM3YO_07375 [Bacteroidota bacterium]
MQNKLPIALVLTLSLLMALSTGCGKRIPTGSDTETPAPVETPAVEPTPVPTTEPTVAPTPAPVATGNLSATLQSVKNGLLGMGAIEATVLVVNDTQNTLSGELRVQFTDGGKADPTHLQTMQVTLQGGEQKTYVFRDKSWSMDNATVEIVTAQPVTSYNYNNYSNYSGYNYRY